MGIRLSYEINSKPLHELLSRIANADTRLMFDEVGGYLDSEVSQRFKEGVDWQGNALAPSIRAEMEGGKTLVNFGHLRDSYTHNVFLDGKGVEHGSDMIYSAIHQFGGKTGRNHAVEMPIRAVMGINSDDEAEISNIVEDFYQRALSR